MRLVEIFRLLLEDPGMTCSASLFPDGTGQLTSLITHSTSSCQNPDSHSFPIQTSYLWLRKMLGFSLFWSIKRVIPVCGKMPDLDTKAMCRWTSWLFNSQAILAMQSGGELYCWIYQDWLPTETKLLCMQLMCPGSSGQLAVHDESHKFSRPKCQLLHSWRSWTLQRAWPSLLT